MYFNARDILCLIKDFGQTLTITKATTAGTYDTTTGSVTGLATKNYSFTGYFYGLSEATTDPLKTLRESKLLAIPAHNLGFTPEEGDLVVGYGDLKSIRTVDSNGSPVVYLCEIEV
jgi:hypothetical protein